ncbi:MAG: hypothetical protein Kow0037_09890 [Calditrichia bacterium]
MNDREKMILEKLDAARNAYDKQNFEKAIELYRELAALLKDDPENLAVIHIELGWCYYQNKQYEQAIGMFREALRSESLNDLQRFDLNRLLGFSYEMLRQPTKAAHFLEKALEIGIPEKEKRFTYFELGKVLFSDGHPIEAEFYLSKAEKLFDESEKDYLVALKYYLGFAEFFQKRYENARNQFDFIVQNATDNKIKAGGYFGLAHLHYQNKEFQALVDICEKILVLDEEFYDKESLGYFLASAYAELNRKEELEAVLLEMERQYPNGRFSTQYPRLREALKSGFDETELPKN